ncbi:DNA cytosine methyltransferase [Streptomyces sp. x-80]|uniref:DNA cytosine methyltransferase n=1 Tax=Streptomyces sp. x-80 TaxID=2789282 RepID=UPI00397FBAD3
MSGPRIGSLCTGYGGLDMAAQGVFGGELAWVADNDPGASRILAHHHPRVPNLGDLTAVDWQDMEPVDIVCGGYPCQPFSTAGKRKGTEDARHIWPHIAAALRALRPALAVFENVAGHLSLGFDTVLADLAADGFDAQWCTLRASDIGAAHQRNRLFLLAWPADSGGQGLARRWAEWTAPHGRRLAAAHTLDLGSEGGRARGAGRDEPAAHHLAAADSQGDGRDEGRAESARQQGGSDAPLGGAPDWGPYSAAIDRWTQITGRPAPRPTDHMGRLSPALVEWLMGLPEGHVTAVPGLSRTAQLKALGNGVVPQQAAHALGLLLAAATETAQERGRAA